MPTKTKTKTRAARPAAKKRAPKADTAKATSRPTRRASTTKKRKAVDSEDECIECSGEEDVSDGYKESEAESAEEDADALDSDALDEDEDVKPGNKRKAGKKAGAKKASPRKRRKKDEEEEQEWDEEGEDGREIVGRVVEAPKAGRVPPGQISQNTFNFLANLKKPECNDRQWFKLHEPVYRVAEQEWKDFIISLTDDLVDVDPQVPPLPPKDVMHRIYRDVRFSNDKTPYKTGFSASFSRGGRKGLFAHFKPGGESMFAAGAWCPGKNELDTIRSHIKHNSRRIRALLKDTEFIKLFGQPKPGKRSSIFGRDDELKNAPKGVAKDHKDIDLLKCRSFAIVHKFSDAQVLSPEFRKELKRVMDVARPFVHCLNDWMTVGLDEEEEEEAAQSGAEEADDDDE